MKTASHANLETIIATENDLAEIAALVNSAYRGESARVGWTNEGHLLKGERTNSARLTVEIKKPDTKILCLREKESKSLVGCVLLELNRGENKDYCYLGMLTVRPTQQNQNLGRYLMTEAENFAKKAGAQHMILGVIQLRTELLQWYLRRGYKPNGETKPFPNDPQYPRITKEPMHFVFMEKAI
ncbi:MAG: GNAT family N-acetyltransferase [Bdellovibrionota bacterium]